LTEHWASAKYSIPPLPISTEMEGTILTYVEFSSSGRSVLVGCQGKKSGLPNMSYFITSVMIIHFIYAETVYMNIVTFSIEQFILIYL
jgi:hypothetical protein